MKRAYQVLVAVALGGCPNPDPPTPTGETTFTTSEEINGTNPEAAIFATFGAVEFADGDGDFLVIVSDNPDPCGQVGDDPSAFIGDVQSGLVPGTVVSILFFGFNGFPGVGEPLVIDGSNGLLDVLFAVSDGGGLLSSGRNDDAGNVITLNELVIPQTMSFTMSASIDRDFVGGLFSPPIELVGEISGATHCQALTDLILSGI